MSNTVALVQALSSIVQIASSLQPQAVRANTSPAGSEQATQGAWQHLTKSPQAHGLDPMTNARCNALTQANTAFFAAANASTQAQADKLTSMGNALLKIHDDLSGAAWYSLPGTVRDLRTESLRLHDSAQNRAVLLKIAESIHQLAVAHASLAESAAARRPSNIAKR